METLLALMNGYERGLVRQALLIAANQFREDSKKESSEWCNKISTDMKSIRDRIEKDNKMGW